MPIALTSTTEPLRHDISVSPLPQHLEKNVLTRCTCVRANIFGHATLHDGCRPAIWRHKSRVAPKGSGALLDFMQGYAPPKQEKNPHQHLDGGFAAVPLFFLPFPPTRPLLHAKHWVIHPQRFPCFFFFSMVCSVGVLVYIPFSRYGVLTKNLKNSLFRDQPPCPRLASEQSRICYASRVFFPESTGSVAGAVEHVVLHQVGSDTARHRTPSKTARIGDDVGFQSGKPRSPIYSFIRRPSLSYSTKHYQAWLYLRRYNTRPSTRDRVSRAYGI